MELRVAGIVKPLLKLDDGVCCHVCAVELSATVFFPHGCYFFLIHGGMIGRESDGVNG